MKKVIIVLLVILVSGCSTTRLVDSWKNEKVVMFKPQKVMVIGMAQNLTARKLFEESLKSEFLKRNINAFESNETLSTSFTDSKKTEEEVNTMISKLSEKGFDAVVITAVKGENDVRNYSQGYYTVDTHWRRFGRYYYRYQDIYYNPGYYNEYKVYHIETSIYNINEDENKSLVWVGSFNVVDPQSINTTVKDYVNAIVKQLEKEGIITER